MRSSGIVRMSPVHACLDRLAPVWQEHNGAQIARHFGDPDTEAVTAQLLGLADRGALARFGLKGPGAIEWASEQGIEVPDKTYGWNRADDGSLTVRAGHTELFLEGNHAAMVESAVTKTAPEDMCFPVLREDAAFLLTGRFADRVLSQVCSYDLRAAVGNFVMTQVALVSCSILVERIVSNGIGVTDEKFAPVYHLWTTASYGPYLWEELLAIVRECGGSPVGEDAVTTLLKTE